MNKVLEYIIAAKDNTSNAIKSALDRVKNFAGAVGRNLANIKAGFDMLGQAARRAGSFLSKAFEYEKMTAQFKTLVGSMDEARVHMKMLQDMGDTPPFSLEQFAAASRSLMIMTDGALGFKKSLELVGDAAAATGQPIENLAHEVGRAYAIIRDGQPITRATMALRSMGAITPEVAAKMDDLQKQGASTVEIWNELQTALSKYKGAMAETETTADGLIAAISSQWDDAMREFGEACLETAKDGLGAILDKMKELRENGTFAEWAEGLNEGLAEAITLARSLRDALHEVGEAAPADKFDKSRGASGNALTFLGNAWAQLGGIGAGLRGMVVPGESFMDNYLAYGALHGYTDFADSCARELSKRKNERGEWSHDVDIRDAAEESRAEVRERARKRQEERAKEVVKREEAEEQKKIAALEEGQKKIEEKRAEEERKNAEEEHKKRLAEAEKEAKKKADEEERARLLVEKAIAKERKNAWDEEIRERRATLKKLEVEDQRAQRRLADAEANAQRAWGWYRDRDSWKAQLDEERANAAAEVQFAKDAERVTSKMHWRTAKLNDEDELIRRVVLAREEEANARLYAKQTAAATERAAEYLETMANVMTDGAYD